MLKTDSNIGDQYREDLHKAVETLKRGGIILYPTDTVWGIGCDATNTEAVAKIYALKRRVESKSMLVLMRDIAQIERYVEEPEEIAFSLIEESVKPITVIFDGATGLAQNLLADDGSVGIRIPKERFTQDILRAFRRPIVSTSANISGAPSAPLFKNISKEIIAGCDYVVTYRRDDNTMHKPSSIIKISKGGIFKIIRK